MNQFHKGDRNTMFINN